MVVGVNKYQVQQEVESINVGRVLRNALLEAGNEHRLMAGLKNAIKTLSQIPEETLFCVMAATSDKTDSATHINQVLLEAFCYENDIYVLKVDSASKLGRILTNLSNENSENIDSCCLIQKTLSVVSKECDEKSSREYDYEEEKENLNAHEAELVDYCEAFWNAPQLPIVQLP